MHSLFSIDIKAASSQLRMGQSLIHGVVDSLVQTVQSNMDALASVDSTQATVSQCITMVDTHICEGFSSLQGSSRDLENEVKSMGRSITNLTENSKTRHHEVQLSAESIHNIVQELKPNHILPNTMLILI